MRDIRSSWLLKALPGRSAWSLTAAGAGLVLALGFAAPLVLGSSGHPDAGGTPAAVEPGLFEFSTMRPSPPAPLGREDAAPVRKETWGTAADTRAAKPPALPVGVERFDRCRENCESRDPERMGAAPSPVSVVATSAPATPPTPATPPAAARPDSALRPPAAVGGTAPEPSLGARALAATQSWVDGVQARLKTAGGGLW